MLRLAISPDFNSENEGNDGEKYEQTKNDSSNTFSLESYEPAGIGSGIAHSRLDDCD